MIDERSTLVIDGGEPRQVSGSFDIVPEPFHGIEIGYAWENVHIRGRGVPISGKGHGSVESLPDRPSTVELELILYGVPVTLGSSDASSGVYRGFGRYEGLVLTGQIVADGESKQVALTLVTYPRDQGPSP